MIKSDEPSPASDSYSMLRLQPPLQFCKYLTQDGKIGEWLHDLSG